MGELHTARVESDLSGLYRILQSLPRNGGMDAHTDTQSDSLPRQIGKTDRQTDTGRLSDEL